MSERRLLKELEREERRKKEKDFRTQKVYLHVLISGQMARLLETYCRLRGLKKGEVVRRALDEFFTRERKRGHI